MNDLNNPLCTRTVLEYTVFATDMLARQDASPVLYASIDVSDPVTARIGVLEHVHVHCDDEHTTCARPASKGDCARRRHACAPRGRRFVRSLLHA